ncbi:hypothetical protein F1880_000840 [Penicillium rolfsii]|nr:hypothetical protein F1880_000840 [Penicillium rolfsii]
MNLMWAIITIQWDIIAYFGYGGTPFPRWIRYVEIIFPVFCIIVTYIGILLCCTRLAGLNDSNIFPADVPSSYSEMTYHNSHSNTLDMESRPMITEADPSRELWEAGSRPIHEADAAYGLRAWKP